MLTHLNKNYKSNYSVNKKQGWGQTKYKIEISPIQKQWNIAYLLPLLFPSGKGHNFLKLSKKKKHFTHFTPSLHFILQTLRTNIEELNDNLKGQTFGLRNPKNHKNKSKATNYGVNSKNAPKPYGI